MSRDVGLYIQDILTHAYFGIDYDIVWDAATNEIPRLKEILEQFKDSD